MCHVRVQEQKNENQENANRKEQEKLAIHRRNGSVSILYFFSLLFFAWRQAWADWYLSLDVLFRNILFKFGIWMIEAIGDLIFLQLILILNCVDSSTWKCNDLPSLTYEGKKRTHGFTASHQYASTLGQNISASWMVNNLFLRAGIFVVLCWYAMHRLIQQIRERPKKRNMRPRDNVAEQCRNQEN